MDDRHRNRRAVPHGVPAVNAAIRAVRKPDVLNDYEVCRYMRLENGLHADVYSLEIIIPSPSG